MTLTQELRDQQWKVHRAWIEWSAADQRAEQARAKYEDAVRKFRQMEATGRAEAS